MANACISQNYSLALRAQFNMSEAEQIIILALSPIVYVTATINVVFFLKNIKKAEPPSDILLFVSLFGMLRITSYLAAAIYDNTHPPFANALPPSSFKDLCDGTGFINVMCQLADFIYNVVFCVYYMVKVRNPLKSWIRDNKQVHVVCLVFILVVTLVFYLTDLVGISILGVCGYKIGPGIIIVDVVFTVSYFVVLVVSSTFFVKYLKSISKVDRSNKTYFKFYFKYLIISSIVYLVGVISLFVVTIKCLQDMPDPAFQNLTAICNVTRILSPVVVFVIMLGHPQLTLASFLRQFNSCFNKKPKNQQMPSFFQDLMTTNRTSIMIELNSLNKNNLQELDYLSKIKDKSKASIINTILGCIALEELQNLQNSSTNHSYPQDFRAESIRIEQIRNSSLNQTEHQIYGWNYLEKSEFELTSDLTQAYSQIFSSKIPTVNLKFVSFSSSIFKKLQQKQFIFNLYDKLLPVKNQANIIENVSTDGGSSGQFFFFNFDKTLIIKTINSTQLGVLRQRIQAYYKYFERNPQSFIVRILGLYKVVNIETEDEISFMIMGNIIKSIPRQYILKSYDLKGSTYKRQVLSKQQASNSQNVQITKTLKDIDFFTIQGKVNISQSDSQQIIKTIEQDVSFLCSQGLIDYSLILLKVNYQKFCQTQKQTTQGLKTYRSTKQEGVVYIFGVIDYLQTWNIRKKSEKWYKSIMNSGDSISSQDPKFYAERFMKNLVMTILR